jgi:hypothetical protein
LPRGLNVTIIPIVSTDTMGIKKMMLSPTRILPENVVQSYQSGFAPTTPPSLPLTRAEPGDAVFSERSVEPRERDRENPFHFGPPLGALQDVFASPGEFVGTEGSQARVTLYREFEDLAIGWEVGDLGETSIMAHKVVIPET